MKENAKLFVVCFAASLAAIVVAAYYAKNYYDTNIAPQTTGALGTASTILNLLSGH